MKGILRIAFAAAVVFGLVLSRFASASPLDGKSFVGEMGEKGKTKGDKDTFVFKEGRFRPSATWTLTVDGDTLTGVSTWKKGNKAPKEYWVKASLKK